MKIAIDIDEVLARGLASYLNYFNASFGTNITEEEFTPDRNFWEVLGVAAADIAEVERHYRASEHSKNWLLVPGAQEAITQLASSHELYIVSNRQAEGHEPTRAWLQRNFGNSFKEIIFTEAERKNGVKPSKAEICVRLGIPLLVEDEVKEVKACIEDGVSVVLFDTRLNQEVGGDKVYRVHDWHEALEQVAKISSKAT